MPRVNLISTRLVVEVNADNRQTARRTGQGDDDLLTKFMENGANRYLTKDDYFIDSLIETIQQVLS